LRRGLFLKDLFVSASRRREGVGRALMRASARLVLDAGGGRLGSGLN
jgi:GNAT superfamily N-acetyltransferase